MKKTFYITTAIDYVNASPHIGHAFEKVIADAIARWKKLNKFDVWFVTGTDENAQKNVQAAKDNNIEIKKFVDINSQIFIELCKKLQIGYNRFIRTTEQIHIEKSQEIFKKIYDKGDIYKGKYEGQYCDGCESFITDKDLIDGKCPEHNKIPRWISENAYFFKLSKYKYQIKNFVKDFIIPESRKNEIISRLNSQDLKDLCVSRANLDWGIDNPIDKKYKIYVWIDALINYLTAENGYWPADLHVIGKGINWFHSVIWPGILLSVQIELPKKLLVHGYLNIEGKKISKSLGNIINPIDLINKYGSDSVRYSLLKCSIFEDSDYSEENLIDRHNNELANKLGNLISRTTALAERYGIKKTENKLLKKLNLNKIESFMNKFELDKALSEIFSFIDKCNEYVQEKKPWENESRNKEKILYELIDSIKVIAILLWPFIPTTAEKIAKQLKTTISYSNITIPIEINKIKKSGILFKKI